MRWWGWAILIITVLWAINNPAEAAAKVDGFLAFVSGIVH